MHSDIPSPNVVIEHFHIPKSDELARRWPTHRASFYCTDRFDNGPSAAF
jgi:hypothetical protein